MLTCFACGKKITRTVYGADTRDDQEVVVGRDCFKHIKEAGEKGYQPPLGGPKLYPLKGDRDWLGNGNKTLKLLN